MLFKGFFFEYYYYRFHHWTRDHGEYKGFQGASIIAVTIGLSAADILLAIESYFNYYPFKNVSGFGAAFGIAAVVLAIYIFKKYDKRMEEFNGRWDLEEEDQRILKGIIIVITLITPLVSFLFFIKT
jgi:hypothetical protein